MAGRRRIGIEDESGWVFNRMVDVYKARLAYPGALVDALACLAGPKGATVGDIGAGIGHLALPLADRGFSLLAFEPARLMLAQLEAQATERRLPVRCFHAKAEALPLADHHLDLAVIADALHFLDGALVGRELGRVLKPRGALAIVACELADTPFMREVVHIMNESAPRRPRAIRHLIAQVAGVAGVRLSPERQHFVDHNPLSPGALEGVLRSVSFIGPAMNESRSRDFFARIRAIPHEPVWSRSLTLYSGRRD